MSEYLYDTDRHFSTMPNNFCFLSELTRYGNKVLVIGLQGIHVYCAVCIYNLHLYWLGLTLMLSPKYA